MEKAFLLFTILIEQNILITMKKLINCAIVLGFTLFLLNSTVKAQSGMLFHMMFIPINDSFYEAGDYQKSIANSLQNDNLSYHDLYSIAQCYALLNKSDSAYLYLNRFIDEISFDCRVVLIDDDFEILRKNNTEWAKITEKIESKFLDSLTISANKEYALSLFRLGVERMKYSYFDVSFDKSEKLSTNQIWKKQSKAIKDFDKLVRKYGFPTQSLVGDDALYTSIEIILHPPIKEKNYLMLQKAFEEGEYLPAHYAWITDRWLTQNGKLQLYGTIFSQEQNADGSIKSVLLPVEDFSNLNKRRAEIGLQTIEEDLKVFGGKIPDEYYGEKP